VILLSRQTVLTLFFTAIVLLVVSAVLALAGRRDGVTARDAFLAGSDLVAYPERYLRQRWIPLVRWLSMAGVIIFILAVAALIISGS
jgi:hypothetical protein